MEIFVNGDRIETSASTVARLVQELGLPPQTLMVEHNGLALHRSEWPDKHLAAGDRIEILRVSAGG